MSTALQSISRYVLALLFFNLTACSSMQAVSVDSAMNYPPPRGVDFGSLVEVSTIDGQKVQFRVTEMTDEGLGGKMGFFRYEDMKELKVESNRESSTDWTAVILGILAVAALVFLVDNADSVAVCSPSPCPTPDP